MQTHNQDIITLRPNIVQWFIDQLPLLVLCLAALVLGGMDIMLSGLMLIVGLFFSLCLLYGFIYMRRIRYIIGHEQLICEHGVFQRSVNYMEMYRIVDFAEHQSLMQQLVGLKNITVLSMDRTTPRLEIIGMNDKNDIVSLIRLRVETMKKKRGIYEITNR